MLSDPSGRSFDDYNSEKLVAGAIIMDDGMVRFPDAPPDQQYIIPQLLTICTDSGPTCLCAANALKYKFKIMFEHLQESLAPSSCFVAVTCARRSSVVARQT